MDYFEESNNLLSLYSVAVGRLRGAHDLALIVDKARNVLGNKEELDEEERLLRLEGERELGELAKTEVASGYRLLSAHAVVGAWGYLKVP
jgi:hypothetical protein